MENVNQQPEQKENMLRYYTESLPYLNAQLVYEELLVKIDEARFKRSSIQYQFAMMMNPPHEEVADSDDDINTTPPPVERKLKRN